ncbi:MFS transporter [Streptomyces sp. NPDC006658]|uniref:MFS transporter n=1 Tax=Streptomyces sp. NPDC006658 TaxID=3156900 RepID=UPI0033FEB678
MTTDARGAVRETGGARPALPRAFWWLWTATLVNRTGGFVVVFLSLYLTLERGFSASFTGFVTTLYGVGGAVGALAGGVVADRWGRRSTLLGAQLLSAVGTAALAFAHGRTAIAVLVCLAGLTGNASRPVVQAVVADMVTEEARVRAFSLTYWAVNIGVAVSSALAGLLARDGFLPLFLGEAVVTAVCALTVYGTVPETRPGPAPGASPVAPPDRADRRRRRLFPAFVGVTFLIALLMQETSTALPLTMAGAGHTTRDYGLVITLNGLIVAALQLPVGRVVARCRPVIPLAVGAVLLGVGLGLTGVAGSLETYAVTVVIWTAGEIILAPTAMATAARLAPRHAHGRYQGVYSGAWAAAACAAPALSGRALDTVGPAALWGTSAVLGALAAVGYVVILRGREDGGRPADHGPERPDASTPGRRSDHDAGPG